MILSCGWSNHLIPVPLQAKKKKSTPALQVNFDNTLIDLNSCFNFPVDIMKLLSSCNPADTNIILVSGDLDFKPVVKEILDKGFHFELWSFKKGKTINWINRK